MRHTNGKLWANSISVVVASLVLFSSSCIAEPSPRPTALVELIAFPDRHEGRFVSVKGYLGNDSLFLTREHADMRDHPSSIMIFDTDEGEIYLSGCSGNYVEIWGELGLSMGNRAVIKDIQKIIIPSTLEACWNAKDLK